MPKNLFSVIIPTLNEEVYLPILLKNLSEQTFQKFEVVVVDGNSEDGTELVAEKFKNKLDLKFYKINKRNASYQRNLGARKAGSKILIFLDADTVLPLDFMKKIEHAFKVKRPDLLTTYIKTDERGIKPIETGTNLIFELTRLLGSPALYGSMLAVKRNVFESVGGFDEKMRYKEDTDLARKIYKEGFKYIILKKTYYEWSLRRFRKLGMIRTLQNYFLLNLDKTLDYQMGGHLFVEKTLRKFRKSRTKELEIRINNFAEKLIDNFKIK